MNAGADSEETKAELQQDVNESIGVSPIGIKIILVFLLGMILFLACMVYLIMKYAI